MNYPIWEVPFLGGGLIVAVIGILHVFIAQFAVGGSLFLILTERKANREGDKKLRNWVREHSRFFVFIVLVFGAITGVGLWLSIGLTTPAGTSALRHLKLKGTLNSKQMTSTLIFPSTIWK